MEFEGALIRILKCAEILQAQSIQRIIKKKSYKVLQSSKPS